ncbi:zf-HC2 domain-containing protein [Corynebacterium sp. TAE3-ERU12]|uniref:zf-HC2 domain-containing protein n=1 Tax=Corynebacterium sp. TAE3-ERU12 TaxID=2849491 RepID=UPI001C485716|nr:zf-HC2 domain-containing protein [Corynebacterium sp. TAE3-ERU12]MBV7295605.1 zf-HC2 domain-containing protein [Corynebacterium sp. TAE3-ERU12]
MECEEIQAALSARLDGEQARLADDVVDAHLDACADCQAWFDQAVSLNRSLLIAPAAPREEPTDLAERILDTVEPQRRRWERRRRIAGATARALLVVLSLGYVAWGIADLQGVAGDAAAAHLAFAVGLLWAAWRPQVAISIAPIYGAVAMFSAGFATRELVVGSFTGGDVARLVLMFAAAAALAVVGFTRDGIVQAWRALAGKPVSQLPPLR